MCGIVGYIGPRDAVGVIVDGLRRLEYRGYDSAGLAVWDAGSLNVRREEGKLSGLEQLLLEAPVSGHLGIGHTRWATHGPPSQRNAHPHSSPDGELVVVQNGIVENFQELRRGLLADGYIFKSDTDTEVIAHLVHKHYNNGSKADLVAAVRAAVAELTGPSAIAVLSRNEPERMVVVRLGNAGGVVIGEGDGEMFVASDIPALLQYTRKVRFLENRQMAVISRDGVEVTDLAGLPIELPLVEIAWDADAAEKGQFRHFMQKEIYDQPQAIAQTLSQRVDFVNNRVELSGLNLTPEAARSLRKLTIVACGTSYYSGLAGRYIIERLARLSVEVDYASEYRYRHPVIGSEEMVLAITQSGETVDTLAALEEAREQGAFTAAIVNAMGSQAARVCDGVIYMHAGPEIGVASTKAFTTSLVDLALLGFYLGQCRGTIDETAAAELVQALAALPGQVGAVLEDAHLTGRYGELAKRYGHFHNFLYLGRGVNYPTAREGALKLKEISYIHAEGYPAGEMKHGPIALIDSTMPTVVVVPQDSVYEKMISQVEQVKARKGAVLAVAHADDIFIREKADELLPIPRSHELLSPVLAVVPLQLLAYEIAVGRGADVDQPRNLAKSVTVE
ncbi:MAG: glutamine--fructose-6-phosphate transaminase (isomerizing) [Chloroflexi bacterium]|nr:MAG: glutamine--fructose-6-phosphate transaminase (isomerizing) [Chloroflexota bacterium]